MTASAAIRRPTPRRDDLLRRARGRSFASRFGVVGALVLAALFVGPIIWVAWGSFQYGSEGLSLANFERLLSYGEGLWRYLANTALVVLITVVGSLVAAVPAGYAFAKMRFAGSKLLFIGILAILMVPHTSLLIPLYIWLDQLGLGNSLVGLSLVMIMYQLPFSVFMMRNSFEGIPKELEEAALIDGCSRFQALRRVVLPVAMPGVITVGLFAFLAAWNEFVTALVLLNDGAMYTLPLALVSLVQGDWGAIDFGVLQAGVVVSAAPCVLLFFILQRYFVSGFTNGAVKG